MKKISMILLSLICIVLVSSFIHFSQAINYYEWVQNGSFEDYINYFEDYSAESNIFNSGVKYGNFSLSGGSFSTSQAHSGIRSFDLSGANYLWYNLTDRIIGADIINASYYVKQASGHTSGIIIYYEDNTYSNTGSYVTITDSWVLGDFVSYIDDAKYVVAFMFTVYGSGSYCYYDDFVLYDVDDDAQSYVSFNTKPFYEPRIWSVDIFQGISSGQKHSGNWSYHDFIAVGDEGFGYQGGATIIQSFIGLDSDLINDFRLYAKTDNEIDLTVMFLYSDESFSTDTKSVNASDWTVFVFDVALPNKVVVGFRIIPYSSTVYTVNLWLDDVSLTATTQYIPTDVDDSDHDGIPNQFDTVDDEEWIDNEETEEKTNNLVDWIVMFIVIFMPALLFAGALYEGNKEGGMNISPVFGIIAGLVLSVGLGVYTSLIPLWMLILMIIAVILLIVGLVRR